MAGGFMACAGGGSGPSTAAGSKGTPGGQGRGAAAASGGQTGVVIVPGDLSVSFNASVKREQYNGMELGDFKGGMTIDSGAIRLNKTGVTLIGAPVEMDAFYKSLSPHQAQLHYHINAKDVNVQRAYKKIKLF